MGIPRETVAKLTALVGVTGAVAAAAVITANQCRVHYAENLILREEPRPESKWRVTETRHGHLLQVANGKFRGWYLAADELVRPKPAASNRGFFGPRRNPPNPYARCVILRDKRGDGCYWTLTKVPGGHLIQAASGDYASWYLGLLANYIPDTGMQPRIAWNLILTRGRLEGLPGESCWALFRRTRDSDPTIRPAGDAFGDWYLDALLDARVLERNRCWGDEPERDGPAPPLAKD